MTTALTVSAFSSFEQYAAAVYRIPLLTPEEELELFARKDTDINAAHKLVTSYLRLVIPVARQYSGYGLPIEDLVQEGNIGLMKAVKKFDVSHTVKLVTYAIYWIKAEIHEYIIRNWRMVKIATTKAQRKLFFNLRRLREHTNGRAMTQSEAQAIATELDVPIKDVQEMELRFAGGDVVIDHDDDDDESFKPIDYLTDGTTVAQVVETEDQVAFDTDQLHHALKLLTDRERDIIAARWLTETPKTLKELADKYGVSFERIRQIEVASIKKLRSYMQD